MAQDLFVGSSTDGQIPKINTKHTVPDALQKKSNYLTKSRTQGMWKKNRGVWRQFQQTEASTFHLLWFLFLPRWQVFMHLDLIKWTFT